MTLTYAQDRGAKGMHQSVYTAYAYKWPTPAITCVENMRAVVAAATLVHGSCMAASAGSLWDLITFVPSTKRDIPLAQQGPAGLARSVVQNSSPEKRLALFRGSVTAGPEREVLPDLFTVGEENLMRVDGKHVLLVEDTWASGSKVQSAAIALHDAGARHVTALCVMRWCRWDWPDHTELLKTLHEPYDPLRCPVSDQLCDPPTAV